MRLLCHALECRGHGCLAGTDPRGGCRFCGRSLADGHGVLLVEPGVEPVVTADLVAIGICAEYGHVWEGHVPRNAEELRGFCSRCGLRIALPA